MMNDFGNFVHDVVVSFVQSLLKINNTICDAKDLVIQILKLVVKLILNFLGADGLMDVLFHVGSILVTLVGPTRFLTFHFNFVHLLLPSTILASRFVTLLRVLVI
jgi:hypothetical protein